MQPIATTAISPETFDPSDKSKVIPVSCSVTEIMSTPYLVITPCSIKRSFTREAKCPPVRGSCGVAIRSITVAWIPYSLSAEITSDPRTPAPTTTALFIPTSASRNPSASSMVRRTWTRLMVSVPGSLRTDAPVAIIKSSKARVRLLVLTSFEAIFNSCASSSMKKSKPSSANFSAESILV